jgi:RNA polymerase sigma-54 factor
VAEAIVHFQREFFDHGPALLRPLPMAAVADRVGVHVATISRAVADKYLQCPRGIFPLRQFFTTGVESDSGESVSWPAIRSKMQDLITGENKSDPLSDDEIVKQLNAEGGLNLARRTVAKYRKLLNIPSARQRKAF